MRRPERCTRSGLVESRFGFKRSFLYSVPFRVRTLGFRLFQREWCCNALLFFACQVRRLDRADLLAHFRKCGARGTYIATTADLFLQTGQKARVVFALPKYTLRYATERPEEMRAMLKLSVASTTETVLQALEHPETSTYDLCRHQVLRRRYTAVYLTDAGKWVDTHGDYVVGGGHSEHALFLSQLMESWQHCLCC